jgi:hypothetical protein
MNGNSTIRSRSMNAFGKAGLCLAAGLLVGCANKKPQPAARAPEAQTIQASETLRQSIQRANPNARVGIVAATYENFAAVNDVPAGTVPENASVQILDASGDVIGYGLVRAVKDNAIHVLYQSDARRGPLVGDLIMPASDAAAPVAEEMPAAAPISPAAQPAAAEERQPSDNATRLPPRRSAAPSEPPADAAVPTDATARPAQPQEPAPATNEPAPKDTAKPQDTVKPEDAAKPADTAQPEAPAAEPAAKDAPKDAATDAPKDAGTTDAPKDAGAETKKDAGAAEDKPAGDKPADQGKAPEADKADQNK